MAFVVKRGKKWTGVYTDRHGKQVWKVGFTHKDKTLEMAQKLEDEDRAIASGLVDPEETRRRDERQKPIANHIAEYSNALRAGGRSDNHIAYTLSDIRQFAEFAGVATASAITREAVDRWVISLVNSDEQYRAWLKEPEDKRGDQAGDPNSARTINRRVGSLQAFLKWAENAGAISRYPLHKYPKRETRGAAIRDSRALTDEEIIALLKWTDKHAKDRGRLYRFALSTGLRSDECAGLRMEHFDMKAATLTIHGKDPRHTDRVDTIPIAPEVVKMIKEMDVAKDAAIFNVPDHAAEQLQADCGAAGINSEGVSFHGLRHTFVTRLARAGVHPTIAQRLARHRDVSITLGYYTHWSVEDDRKALAAVCPQCNSMK
jgi:integrase